MKPGAKVTYLGASDAQVNWGGNDDPRGLLNVGVTYIVAEVEEHSWHTKLTLAECPSKRFNSASFQLVSAWASAATPQTPVVQIYSRDGEFDVVVGEAIADRLCFDEMLGQVVALTIPMCGTLASRVASGQPLFRMYTPEDLVARAEKHNAAMARNATLRTAEDEQRQADRVDAARYRKLCELVGQHDPEWTICAPGDIGSAEDLSRQLDAADALVVDAEFVA